MEIPENKSLHYNSTEMTYLVASTTNDEPGNSTANSGVPLFCYYLPSLFYGLSGGAFAVFVLSFSYLGDLAAREPSTRLRRWKFEVELIGKNEISIVVQVHCN